MDVILLRFSESGIIRVKYDTENPCFGLTPLFCPRTKCELRKIFAILIKFFRYRLPNVQASETLETLYKCFHWKNFTYRQGCILLYSLFCIWFSVDTDSVYVDVYAGKVYFNLDDIK